MSGTQAPLRIEIVDPSSEPLDGGWVDIASASASAEGIDDWVRSIVDARDAARRHVTPVTRRLSAVASGVQRALRAFHERSLQLRTDGNPRRGSAVRQHVFAPFDTLASRLPGVARSVTQPGVSLELSTDFTPLPGGGRQAEATLALRGSWPRLPMVVRVEPWWREQSIVTVELRTRRRLRYPRRYFRGAHAAARALSRELSD